MLMALIPTDSKPAGLQLISSLLLVIGYFTFHLSSFPPFEPHRHIGHLVFFKLYYCGFYFQLSLIFNHPKISHKGAKTIREFSLPFTVYFLLFTVYYSPLISHLSSLISLFLLFTVYFLQYFFLSPVLIFFTGISIFFLVTLWWSILLYFCLTILTNNDRNTKYCHNRSR